MISFIITMGICSILCGIVFYRIYLRTWELRYVCDNCDFIINKYRCIEIACVACCPNCGFMFQIIGGKQEGRTMKPTRYVLGIVWVTNGDIYIKSN